MELLEANDLQDKVKVVRMGVPDEIVSHGDPNRLLGDYGLDADGTTNEFWTRSTPLTRNRAVAER